MITLGTYTGEIGQHPELKIVCDDPEMREHVDRPWFRATIERQLGIRNGRRPHDTNVNASVDDNVLARHTLICGGTGSGKSRLMEHLVIEQIRLGCSALVLDPKGETIDHLIGHLERLGVPPEQVTVIDPRLSHAVPGWNPLRTGIPVCQAARDFVSVLEHSTTSWGPRMQDLLTNALIVTGEHGLSLYELVRFLLRDDYRQALLKAPVSPSNPTAHAEAHSFFVEEFGVWSKSERAQAVGPVLNKLREFLRSPFLSPLLCAKHNTLDLRKLWRDRHIVLVHLDRTTLGDEGVRLLSGLLTHLLFRTALRARGGTPVVLAVDEMATVERFVGEALGDVVTVARSQGLRLLVACQHLAQLSDKLRSALLGNAVVQAFFRLGYADARVVAASLAAGHGSRITRIVVAPDGHDRYTGETPRASWRHVLHDPHGRPLRMTVDAWRDLMPGGRICADPTDPLRRMAVRSHVRRLYVRSADRGEPQELSRYVSGLPPSAISISGPRPIELVVEFPRPRIQKTERSTEHELEAEVTRLLQELPVQHAVIRVGGGVTRTARICDVATPHRGRSTDAYVDRAMRTNGQSDAEARSVMASRQREVDRVASGREPGSEGKTDDGSIE